MQTKICSDHTLDCREMACSEVLAKLKGTMSEMKEGEVVEVFTTDVCTEYDLPNWVQRKGSELLAQEHVTVFHIRKQ